MVTESLFTDGGAAELSDDGMYRYSLRRTWGPGIHAVFVMLNPSTADATQDDPTIRRCIGFAKREHCGGLLVVNLYAYRATKPADLWRAADPVGRDNDFYLADAAVESNISGAPLIAAWGALAGVARAERARRLLGHRLSCLGLTKSGAPRHPLYLAANSALRPFAADPIDYARRTW